MILLPSFFFSSSESTPEKLWSRQLRSHQLGLLFCVTDNDNVKFARMRETNRLAQCGVAALLTGPAGVNVKRSCGLYMAVTLAAQQSTHVGPEFCRIWTSSTSTQEMFCNLFGKWFRTNNNNLMWWYNVGKFSFILD